MKRKYLPLYAIILLLGFIIHSCGTLRNGGEGITHNHNKAKIEQDYNRCLLQAQNESDSSDCEKERAEKMNEEEERHRTEININLCEKFQIYTLRKWGYDALEANKIAETILQRTYSTKKSSGYELDCDEAIKELISYGCSDKTAIPIVLDEINKYEEISESAENVTKQYYEEGLYENHGISSHYGGEEGPYRRCKAQVYYIGEDIKINETILKVLGLLDDDEDEDEDEDEDNNNPPSTPTEKDQTKSKEDRDTTGTYNNDKERLKDLSVITNTIISNYEIDVTQLSNSQKESLDNIIYVMKEWSDVEIIIVGHTCNIGTYEINKIVGLRRAQNAKEYMIANGIEASRIQTISKADEEPVTTNNTISGRKQNRRITFILN